MTDLFELGVQDGMEKVAGRKMRIAAELPLFIVKDFPHAVGAGAQRIGGAISMPVRTLKAIAKDVREAVRTKPSKLHQGGGDPRAELRDSRREAMGHLFERAYDVAALGGAAAGAKYLHGKHKKRKKTAGDGGGDRSYDITHSSWPKQLKKMKRGKGPKAAWASRLKTAAAKKIPITSSERARFKAKHGDVGCSLGRDKKGYYVYTHRARSPSYPTPESIPSSRVRFVESTG